jgi:SAM-dependent methyltransferase
MPDRNRSIRTSWDDNATRWAEAVRSGAIRSRAVATDAAIVDAVTRLRPGAVLDLGCGEGWLVRRLNGTPGCRVVGVDGSADLIRLARTADPGGDYRVVDYDAIATGAAAFGEGFDAVIANFALLSEDIVPLLGALLRAAPQGVLVIQTVHPWTACGDLPYADGWREESFATFGSADWSAMPWFFRTLASWHRDLTASGWRIDTMQEPVDPESGRPLSLLLSCVPGR